MTYTTLISVNELKSLDPAPFLVDCSFDLVDPDKGRVQYLEGHIPGAVYAHLNNDLSDLSRSGAGRHPLPDRQAIATWLKEKGLRQGQQVVAYDQGPGAYAARLWWQLRHLGHEQVAVLDGGLAAWRETEATTTDEPALARGDFIPAEPLNRTITAEDLPGFTGAVLDAREEARFRGEMEPIDPVAGHIPGASCHPFTSNLEVGRFRSTEALRQAFSRVEGENVVCYCGSGVTATHNILAMVHAGLPEPILYPGSWSEWVSDPTRPIATGD